VPEVFVARTAGGRRSGPAGEELPLDVEVLEGGFDHKPARGELGQADDERRGGRLLQLPEAPLLDAAVR
jgi:hypothetical protein